MVTGAIVAVISAEMQGREKWTCRVRVLACAPWRWEDICSTPLPVENGEVRDDVGGNKEDSVFFLKAFKYGAVTDSV